MTTLKIDMPEELVEQLARIESQLAALSAKIAPDPEYMTTADVARVLRMSEYTVRKYVRDGKLKPARRDGNKILFHPADINRVA